MNPYILNGCRLGWLVECEPIGAWVDLWQVFNVDEGVVDWDYGEPIYSFTTLGLVD